MNSEYDILLFRLEEHAEWAEAEEWNVPITLSDDIRAACEAIRTLISCKYALDRIMELPSCNDCFKRNDCGSAPKLGDYVRINCPFFLGGK
jgi:hypothetical protein